MDHQYRENGARNKYSSYNQMRAYVTCSPNQSKKIMPKILTFPSSSRRNFEESGKVLIVSVSEFTTRVYFCSSALLAHAYKIVTTTV